MRLGPSRNESEFEPEVKDLRRKLNNAIENNRRHVVDVELNLAFLSGNQWTKAYTGEGIVPVANAANEFRVVDNRMIQVYIWKLQQLFRQRPVITAFASGSDMLDEETSLAASRLADHWRQNNGWEEAEKECAQWVEVAGGAWLAPVWRSKVQHIQEITVPVYTGTPMVDDNGRITFSEHKLAESKAGDIAFDVYSSLQTYAFPQYETRWRRITGILTADLVSYDWGKQHLRIEIAKEHLNRVEPGDINLAAIERVRRNVYAGFNLFNNEEYPLNEERYLLLQYRERPTNDYPRGRYMITFGDILVHNGELPYVAEAREVDPNDELNITMGMIPWFAYDLPGFLVPPSPQHILRSHQIRINDLKTDEMQNRKTVGRNKIFYDETMIDDDSFTNEHGEMIPMHNVQGGQLGIHTIQGQPLVGINQEILRAEQAFDEAAGRPSLFRGENPPQVRSAFHLDILREEAQTSIGAFIKKREEFHQLTAKLALAIAKKRYTTKQIIKILGADKAGHAFAFKKADLFFDIIVKEGSALPRNKAAAEAKALELFRIGAFMRPNGQNDVSMLWDILEIGHVNRNVNNDQLHRNRARYENKLMLFGDIESLENLIPIEEEDHDLHVEIHRAELARPEFYAAAAMRKSLYMAHLQMHVDFQTKQNAPEAFIPPSDTPMGIDEMQLQGAAPRATLPEMQGAAVR
jgi:hypothetical protein